MPPSKKNGWIEWRDSMPKRIIMDDLQAGYLPIDAEEMSAEEAWVVCYQNMAEFVCAGVVFDQFKKRLQDHRKQVRDQTTRATQEEEALECMIDAYFHGKQRIIMAIQCSTFLMPKCYFVAT
jgi:hypothetical protein